MNNNGDLTYSEAIEQVMRHNGYFAPLKLLYNEIWSYKDKSKIIGRTPDFTIQERVQRDPRFTRIAKGVYALTAFLEQVEKEDLGFFTVEKNEVVFKEARKFVSTVKVVEQKVNYLQQYETNKKI